MCILKKRNSISFFILFAILAMAQCSPTNATRGLRFLPLSLDYTANSLLERSCRGLAMPKPSLVEEIRSIKTLATSSKIESFLANRFLRRYSTDTKVDLGDFSTAGKDILLYTDNFSSSDEEVKNVGGRVTHKLTDRVFVAHFPGSVSATVPKLRSASEAKPENLDQCSTFMAKAWFESVKPRILSDEVLSWGDPSRQAPRNSYNDPALRKQATTLSALSVKPTSTVHALVEPAVTSQVMKGRIAFEAILVSGESAPGKAEYLFTPNEKLSIWVQIFKATKFLAHEGGPLEYITFHPYVPAFPPKDGEIKIIAAPGTNTKNYEAMEAPWRDAALRAMNLKEGLEGISQRVDQLLKLDVGNGQKPQRAFVAFFTKYPLAWAAYASGQRFVMSSNYYDNTGKLKGDWGGWGIDRINQIFAHETCHLFGAADEYNQAHSKCTCDPSGFNKIENGNCINCITPPAKQSRCLMATTELTLCTYSRQQLGWSPKKLRPGTGIRPEEL